MHMHAVCWNESFCGASTSTSTSGAWAPLGEVVLARELVQVVKVIFVVMEYNDKQERFCYVKVYRDAMKAILIHSTKQERFCNVDTLIAIQSSSFFTFRRR
jgi:hypothetical protein